MLNEASDPRKFCAVCVLWCGVPRVGGCACMRACVFVRRLQESREGCESFVKVVSVVSVVVWIGVC